MLKGTIWLGIAGLCTWAAVFLAIHHIVCHIRNYTEPTYQRYIIRIVFMVPMYAICSWLSLVERDISIYYDTIRDCYEAWVIYNFMALCLAYVGGPGAVVTKAEGHIVKPSWTWGTCCLPPMAVDGFFLRRCKQGTLQFVLLKPVMAALTLILYAAHAYTDGDWSPTDGYFYLAIMYNVCYTLALYALLLFYLGTEELLAPYKPMLKFILIKTVIFLTFWQGIAISMVNSMGRIKDPEDAKALQNFMICLEMLGAAVMMRTAFPHNEYNIGGAAKGFRWKAFTHAISIQDVVADVVHQFSGTYHDYVLYSDGGPADNVKRKNFRGQETTEHPKSSLIKNMERGGTMDMSDGGSEHPKAQRKLEKSREKQRRMAVLLDSDSDGMDSDEEDNQLGTMEMDEGGSPSSPGRQTLPRKNSFEMRTSKKFTDP